MQKPSDWLSGLVPDGIYRESKLYELRDAIGLVYDATTQQLTSQRHDDRPYLTYGRHGTVDVHDRRDLRRLADELRLELPPGVETGDGRVVFGFEIIVGVWKACGPIISLQPPSVVVRDPQVKARLDIASLRQCGV